MASTTIYVSQSTDNGYEIGNDSNDGSTKALAKLTITGAASVATTDDIIIINDGIYDEANYVTLADTGLTVRAENSRQVTITNQVSPSRVFHITRSATINGIIVDAENTKTQCITFGTNSDLDFTFTGGGLVNPTTSFILNSRFKDFTMNGGWTATGSLLSNHGIFLVGTDATCDVGTISISDGVMTIDDMTNANDSGIQITSDFAGIACEIFNVDITMSTTTPENVQNGINVTSMASLNIYSNNITLNDSIVGIGIKADVSAIGDTDVVSIYLNTLSGVEGATGGVGIQCGSDSAPTPTGANSLKNASIFSNIVNGFNHGILIAWVTDAKVYSNKVSNTVLGCIAKSTTTCKITGNVIIDNTGDGALLAKGDTDSDFANNLAITNQGVTTTAMIAARVNVTGDSTGTKWTNNILFNNGGTVTRLVNYLVNQAATFVNNNTYSNDVIPANSWRYAALDIADFTAWEAHGQTTGELNIDPVLSGYKQTASGLLGTGVNWGDMYKASDYNGQPFPAYDIDIGSIQGIDNTNHPFAPPNL